MKIGSFQSFDEWPGAHGRAMMEAREDVTMPKWIANGTRQNQMNRYRQSNEVGAHTDHIVAYSNYNADNPQEGLQLSPAALEALRQG